MKSYKNNNVSAETLETKLLLNEEQLAERLGQPVTLIRNLRKLYGLPVLPWSNLHGNYYYWPSVDEFMRNLTKPASKPQISENAVKPADDYATAVNQLEDTALAKNFKASKTKKYKEMDVV